MNGFLGRNAIAKFGAQRSLSKLMITSALVAAGTLGFISSASAADYELPSTPTIIGGGAATFATSGVNLEKLDINQTTQRVVINWNTFNIGADATVQFNQIDSNSIAVNRVSNDGQFSRINGRLIANGKVMILDPNGVLFGAGSITDVGAIVASTGDIDVTRVMAGDLALQLTNFGTGQVINSGTINAADSGLVALVGTVVKNNGVINATLGRVALAAGNETATVDLYGDSLVSLAYTDKNDNLLSENTGEINAVGGKIQLTAAAAKDVVDSVVNMDGVATANTAIVTNGKIILSAKKVKVGSASHVKGNTTITAKTVDLNATIDGVVDGSADEINVISNNAKINQALNIALNDSVVNVGAGTYDEDLIISQARLTLNGNRRGISAGDASRGVNETILTPHSPGIVLTGNGVTIDGIVIDGASNGIESVGMSNITLKNNIITNSTNNAIYLTGGANNTINNNRIDTTGSDGMYIGHVYGGNISNNLIGTIGTNNNIYGNGILLDGSSLINIVSNTITETTSTAGEIGSGVHIVNGNSVNVRTNTISNAEWDAVKVTGGSNILIDSNDFDNLKRVGVFARNTNGIVVSNNDIDNASLYGVQFMDVKGLSEVLSNAIDKIGLDAINMSFSSNIKITNNMIGYGTDGLLGTADDTNIGRDGLAFIYAHGTDARSNKVAHTKRDGIHVENASGVKLVSNTVDYTAKNGVNLLKSANAQILNNRIGTVGVNNNINGDGVLVNLSNGAIIKGNTITETTSTASEIGSGVHLLNSNTAVVGGVLLADKNTISNAEWDAVKITNGSNILVEGNDFDNLKRVGVYALKTNGLTIRNNDIDVAGLYGVQVDGVQSTSIIGNQIDKVGLDGVSVRYNSNNVNVLNNVIGYGADGILGTADDKNTGRDGISVVYSTGANILGNSLARTGRHGIYGEAASSVSIIENKIDGTTFDGVSLISSSNATINSNMIGYGADDSVNTFDDTVIGRDGVRVIRSAHAVADFNRIANARGNGIYMNDVINFIEIDNNTIHNSGLNGVLVENPTDFVEIIGNGIYNSGVDGVHVSNYFGSGMPIFMFAAYDGEMAVVDPTPLDGLYINTNTISDSLNDGIEVANSNGTVDIKNNGIDNSGSNGVGLYQVGGLVTVESNHITDSGYNGIYASNYGSPILSFARFDEESFVKFSNPIELHIINNIIENIGFVPGGVSEGDVFAEAKLMVSEEIISGEGVSTNYNPFGFAAVNLDISGDGYAELSGNSLGNNFQYGLVAYSGTIDLTGASNFIKNTDIGMGFYPAEFIPDFDSQEYFDYLASQLHLVNDTIGTTKFFDQSSLFVDLGYGAFFAPGLPTILDGNNASYTLAGSTIAPSLSGGLITSAEYTVLENFLNHYVDAQNRGLFFFNVLPDALGFDQKDVLRDIVIPFNSGNGGSLTVTGLPSIGGFTGNTGTPAPQAFNPNAIEPAAGDEEGVAGQNPDDVAGIQPAAGDNADPSSCWADATQSLGQGTPVTFNFGSGPSALLQDAAQCGNGQGPAQNL